MDWEHGILVQDTGTARGHSRGDTGSGSRKAGELIGPGPPS
jgi:hypothetical protein